MKRLLYALLCSVLLSSCITYKPELSDDLSSDLQKVTDHFVEKNDRIGLALLYSHPEKGVIKVVSGHRESNQSEAIDGSELYEIGSATKLFISTVVLQMAEENQLSLEDTIPVYGFDFPHSEQITIQDLLQHTSGIPDYFNSPQLFEKEYDYQRFRSEEELIEIALTMDRLDEEWSYSNTNYLILALIIEQMTGIPASLECRNRILKPLSMDHTFFRGKEEQVGISSHGYIYEKNYWDTWEGINPQYYSYAGAMVSTLDDMYLFLSALQSGNLLNEESMKQMMTFVPANESFNYGLGILEIDNMDRLLIGHGGCTFGTISYALYCRDSGEYFIYYSNLFNDDLQGFENSLHYVLDSQ